MARLIGFIGAAIALTLSAVPAFAGPTVAAPEPASLGLLAVGIGGVALAKFRPRK